MADQNNPTRGLNLGPEWVFVFISGKPSIGFSRQICCNPGDKVIYPRVII